MRQREVFIRNETLITKEACERFPLPSEKSTFSEIPENQREFILEGLKRRKSDYYVFVSQFGHIERIIYDKWVRAIER